MDVHDLVPRFVRGCVEAAEHLVERGADGLSPKDGVLLVYQQARVLHEEPSERVAVPFRERAVECIQRGQELAVGRRPGAHGLWVARDPPFASAPGQGID